MSGLSAPELTEGGQFTFFPPLTKRRRLRREAEYNGRTPFYFPPLTKGRVGWGYQTGTLSPRSTKLSGVTTATPTASASSD
jgi:hypothetical protein